MRDIKEMAREVKLPYDYISGEPLYPEKLEAFANLVRADEREACAIAVEGHGTWAYTEAIAAAIRARGQA